jgi:hypothetical protein
VKFFDGELLCDSIDLKGKFKRNKRQYCPFVLAKLWQMSDIVSWWSACCAFTVMLLLGTVLLGRFLSAVRIVFKATYSSVPAKAIGELTCRGKDASKISAKLKRATDKASQVVSGQIVISITNRKVYDTIV